jgi:F420-non-reducing hydrogenase small subunit
MGPATRGGCGTPCIDGNMPCTGCLGPTDRVRDQGAKALAGLMSSVEAKDPQAIEKVVQAVPDPIGLLYRYSLAGSVLAHCKQELIHGE